MRAAPLEIERVGSRLRLRGPIGFASAREGLAAIGALLGNVEAIDLAGVTHADSAGLALLLECLKRAAPARLRLESPPPQLLALARAMALGGLFEAP